MTERSHRIRLAAHRFDDAARSADARVSIDCLRAADLLETPRASPHADAPAASAETLIREAIAILVSVAEDDPADERVLGAIQLGFRALRAVRG